MDQASQQARAASGDRAAFSGLMSDTKGGLFRFVRRYVGDPEDALDLVQDSYVSAWLAIDRYDPTLPFEAWLRTIALNKCRDWTRRRTVRRFVRGAVGLDSPEASRIGDPAPGADALHADRSRLASVQAAIVRLPDGLRAPLLLSTLEGRSHAEIGRILGLTPKAVEVRIARARKQLRAWTGDEDAEI